MHRKNHLKSVAFLLIYILYSPLSFASSTDKGIIAYDKGNFSEAAIHFIKAADQGDANAQYLLGVMYLSGLGVTKDDKKAFKYFGKAADQGGAKAQDFLGSMYANGHGVTQNYKEAVKWYRKAAEQGNVSAQLSLGLIYANGQGITQNYIIAHKWWNIAGSSGNTDAVKNRDIIAKRMTPTQIAEAQKLAREWKPK